MSAFPMTPSAEANLRLRCLDLVSQVATVQTEIRMLAAISRQDFPDVATAAATFESILEALDTVRRDAGRLREDCEVLGRRWNLEFGGDAA